MMDAKGLIHPSDYISMYEFYTIEKVLHTTKISTFSKNHSLQHIFNPIVIKQNKHAAKVTYTKSKLWIICFCSEDCLVPRH